MLQLHLRSYSDDPHGEPRWCFLVQYVKLWTYSKYCVQCQVLHNLPSANWRSWIACYPGCVSLPQWLALLSSFLQFSSCVSRSGMICQKRSSYHYKQYEKRATHFMKWRLFVFIKAIRIYKSNKCDLNDFWKWKLLVNNDNNIHSKKLKSLAMENKFTTDTYSKDNKDIK